ncbi:MAG: hypothetical protein ACYTF0_01190 [Planctomycetota bacterium]|jgi:oligoribonuclease NrnB/cAMP/cGMP phosphodiesterase (DHH superfamily)
MNDVASHAPVPEPHDHGPAPLCIFHRNCLDGRSAAAVVLRKEGRSVEFLPMTYGNDRPPPVYGRRVYILDCAYPIEIMRELEREAAELIWLDHHATNVDMHATLGFGTLDQSECGASLAWLHCYPDEPLPDVLRYVRDKDLWQWKLPHSREIAAGLESRFTDQNFAGLLDVNLDKMRRRGEPILIERRKQVRTIASKGRASRDPYGQRERKAWVVNSLDHISDVGEHACQRRKDGGKGCDLLIAFAMRRDGRWIHSLRSNDSIDCERIAQARGGGGHPNAASYTADTPFPSSHDCLDWPV